jgi:ribose 5-phosphate isomerase B
MIVLVYTRSFVPRARRTRETQNKLEKEGIYMKIAFGCDPNATDFKATILKYVQGKGFDCVDFGSDDPIYANTAIAVAEAVAAGECERGILVCGTGIGVCIAANKVKGAYAALVNNVYQAQRAQLSNCANIITMGAQVTGIEVAKMMVDEYLGCTFDTSSRSMPKVQRVYDYESEVMKP